MIFKCNLSADDYLNVFKSHVEGGLCFEIYINELEEEEIIISLSKDECKKLVDFINLNLEESK